MVPSFETWTSVEQVVDTRNRTVMGSDCGVRAPAWLACVSGEEEMGGRDVRERASTAAVLSCHPEALRIPDLH